MDCSQSETRENELKELQQLYEDYRFGLLDVVGHEFTDPDKLRKCWASGLGCVIVAHVDIVGTVDFADLSWPTSGKRRWFLHIWDTIPAATTKDRQRMRKLSEKHTLPLVEQMIEKLKQGN